MTGFGSKTLLALSTAGVVLATSPAFAIQWTCVATNARHASYIRQATGFNSVLTHNRASAKALEACEIDGGGGSCRIAACTPSA